MSKLVIEGPEWWARSEPEKEAVLFEGDSGSYGELNEWADRSAADLASRGVEPGDRGGVLGGNCIEYCVCVLGAVRPGAVLVPMNARLTANELAVLTTSSEPEVVYTAESLTGTATEMAELGPDFAQVMLSEITALRSGDPAGFQRPE